MSLDDDVSALLEQVRRSKGLTFKQVVTDALREGLSRMNAPAQPQPSFQTGPVDLGNCLYPNLDNVWDVLEDVELSRSGR